VKCQSVSTLEYEFSARLLAYRRSPPVETERAMQAEMKGHAVEPLSHPMTAVQRHSRALLVGTLVSLLLVAVHARGVTPSSGYPCFSSLPATFLDPKHPKGYRTIKASSIDANYMLIQGRNSAHSESTFTLHGLLERGGRTLVADFSAIGGPPALHGHCAEGGDISWADGNTWRRGARLSELLALGTALAEDAASVIRSARSNQQQQQQGLASKDGEDGSARTKAVTDEGVAEPVTAADAASNQVLVSGWQTRWPGLALLTEEKVDPKLLQPTKHLDGVPDSSSSSSTSASTKDSFHLDADPVYPLRDLLVTIDPLDATHEYTEGLLQYVTTQQCIVLNGRPVAGIIHQPFEKQSPTVAVPSIKKAFEGSVELTTSQMVGSGWASAPKLAVAGRRAPMTAGGGSDSYNNHAKVAVSRSHTGSAAQLVADSLPGKTALLAGGAGYKALLVARGQAGAYLHATKSKAWDACAADALITARGGTFTDVAGAELVYNPHDPVLRHGLLGASTARDHQWFVERLKDHPIALSGNTGDRPAESTFLRGLPG